MTSAMPDRQIWPVTARVYQERLWIAGCDVVELAEDFGTPLYIFDEATFRSGCQTFIDSLPPPFAQTGAIRYAGKALLNSRIASIIREEDLGLDVVSGGEIAVARNAGFPAERIGFHGNAKSTGELREALSAGVGTIVVDSIDELQVLAKLAASRAVPQRIGLRVEPGVNTNTHAHIQTGQANSKFGVALRDLPDAADIVARSSGLQLSALHAHLGSQLCEIAPYVQTVNALLDAALMLRERSRVAIGEIVPGGGFSVAYRADDEAIDIREAIGTISKTLTDGCIERGLPFIRLGLEPGRAIVGRSVVAVYRTIASKPLSPTAGAPARRFVHIDGGIGDNIRPALYGAQYTATVANRPLAPASQVVHIAGRYCESSDVLVRNIRLPEIQPGDLIAVPMAGAYTLSMASNYNMVCRPPLVSVCDGAAELIQRRETYEDLLCRDIV